MHLFGLIIVMMLIIIVVYFVYSIFKNIIIRCLDLENEVNNTLIVENPQDLINDGYCHLTNILNQRTSMMDPNPGAVIRQFKSRGYEVVICPVAYKKNGGRSYSCSSLWGKYKLHVIR